MEGCGRVVVVDEMVGLLLAAGGTIS